MALLFLCKYFHAYSKQNSKHSYREECVCIKILSIYAQSRNKYFTVRMHSIKQYRSFQTFILTATKLSNSDIKPESNIPQGLDTVTSTAEKFDQSSIPLSEQNCTLLFRKQTRAFLIDARDLPQYQRLDYLLHRVEKYTKCL